MADVETSHDAGLSITVILCSYNRCGSLAATLDTIAASNLPDSVTWEVLVVDNNSTDQTREVAESFCQRYPGLFRYLFEPISGKSYALNSGVRHARGKILAFVDDDVEVDPGWLARLTSSLSDGKWAGAGGRTLAAQAFTAPDWFSNEESGGILYGRFDFGDEPRQLDCAPFGANMAFRKEMFEKYGGFRTDLGPGPDSRVPRPNEDTEFGRRLMAAGERLRYEPGAVLRHPVEIERLNQPFFLKFWFDYGRANALELKAQPVWGIKRKHASLLKHLLLLPLEAIRWLLSPGPQARFRYKCRVWRSTGHIVETYRRLPDC